MAKKLFKSNPKKLVIVVPCFNEEEVLGDTNKTLLQLLKSLISEGLVLPTSRICYVNDGSHDKTWGMIEAMAKSGKLVNGICLSRNFGHQGALLAGLLNVDADAYVTIDADLQDDEKVIRDMVKLFNSGSDVVYGVRDDRSSDSFIKRVTAVTYYRILKFLGADIVHNHADFRLMSKRAVTALKEFPERNLFLRATVPLLGFKSSKVYFARKKRQKGVSKYPFSKMVSFSWEGITSFSVVPLRMITVVGFLALIFSLALIGYSGVRWFEGHTVSGWASVFVAICFFSGLELVSIGVVGEYLGKTYSETKNRPRYIVEKKIVG